MKLQPPHPSSLSAGREGFRLLCYPIDPSGILFFLPASPQVRLHLANEALPPTLICNIIGYYPLDVTVKWTREELGGAPVPVSDASFSSLRQNAEGTYSISSSLTAEPGSAGATYTCQVIHISREEPFVNSTWAAPPGTGVPTSTLGLWLSYLQLIFGLVLLPTTLCSFTVSASFEGSSLHSCHHHPETSGRPRCQGTRQCAGDEGWITPDPALKELSPVGGTD